MRTSANELQDLYGEVGVGPAFPPDGHDLTPGLKAAVDAVFLLPNSPPRLAHVTATIAAAFELGATNLSLLTVMRVGADEPCRTTFARPVVFSVGFAFGF